MKLKSGFTLIELSITLVIIGLVIGGVLVGRDMIKAAELRATMGQKEKFDTAANVFSLKYNGTPGDLFSTSAAAFGMFNTGMTGAAGLGDSNGLIQSENSAAYPNEPDPYSEALVFWRHLSDAQLIDGNYGKDLSAKGYPPTDQTVAQMSLWMPTPKIGRGSIAIAAINGKNHYVIYTGLDGAYSALYTTAQPTWYSSAPTLTPIEAKNIDNKIDDGMPASGTVRASSANNTKYLGEYPDLSENCTSGSSPDNYKIAGSYKDSITCSITLETD